VLREADGKTLTIWYPKQGSPLTGKWRSQSRTVTLPRRSVAISVGDLDGDGKKEILIGLAQGGLAIMPPACP
jgi:hypothetical protein